MDAMKCEFYPGISLFLIGKFHIFCHIPSLRCTNTSRNACKMPYFPKIYIDFYSFRLTIATPAQFEQFQNHTLGTDAPIVQIEETAFEDLFALAGSFDQFANVEIRFTLSTLNSIVLFPQDGRVEARFTHGQNTLAQYLPTTYKEYDIAFSYGVRYTANDTDALFSCANAESVRIYDVTSVLAQLLQQQATGFTRMTKLRQLAISISMPDEKVQVAPFLVHAPALEVFSIAVPLMTSGQFNQLANGQRVPDAWWMERHFPTLVYYKK